MLFFTFWLLFGQAKSNKACMADAKQNEMEKHHENKEQEVIGMRRFTFCAVNP